MKRIFYFVIPAVLLFGLIGWRFAAKRRDKAAQDKAATARKNAPPNVTIAPAVIRDIIHDFEGVGSADAPYNVRISSKVTGLLTYLNVREGDAVTTGQVVAKIDPAQILAQVQAQRGAVAEAQQRLSQAEITANPTNVQVSTQIRSQNASVNSAKANFNQTQQNYASQVAAAQAAVTDAQGRVDTAEAAIRNAEAQIRSAQANLNNAQVKYDRTYDLYKQGFVAAQDVDDARTQVDVERGALDVATAQRNSAQASRDSAAAQKKSALDQLAITKNKGKSDIEASRALYQQSQAGLDLARANNAQKPAYQANLAALRSAVVSAQAQERNLESQLSDTTLRSSVNGYVTARTADPGTVVTAGQSVLTIEAIKQIYVTTSVPEDVSRQVHEGMSAIAVFDALPNQKFTGPITQVNPAADPSSRQFTVRLTLDNPRQLIKPGMFSRVTIETQRTRSAVVVPREAVKPGKNGPTVTVVDAQMVAHVRPVQTGDSDAAGIQITQGIQAGENVVTLSQNPVKDGVKVAVGSQAPGSGAAPQVNTNGGGGIQGGGNGQPSGGGANAPTYGGGSAGSGSGADAGSGTSGGANGGGSAPGGGSGNSSNGSSGANGSANPTGATGSVPGTGSNTGGNTGGAAQGGASGTTGGAGAGGTSGANGGSTSGGNSSGGAGGASSGSSGSGTSGGAAGSGGAGAGGSGGAGGGR